MHWNTNRMPFTWIYNTGTIIEDYLGKVATCVAPFSPGRSRLPLPPLPPLSSTSTPFLAHLLRPSEGHNLNENHNLSEPYFISLNVMREPSPQPVPLAPEACFLSLLRGGKAQRGGAARGET